MNRILLTCIGTLATVSMAGTAFAAPRVAPPNTLFTATGPATLSNPPISLSCVLKLEGKTGNPLATPPLPAGAPGGDIIRGTNTGPGLCSAVTIDPATFTVLTVSGSGTGTGVVNGLIVRLGGSAICTATAPTPFTFTNGTPSTINFSGLIPGTTCSVVTALTPTPNLTVYP
ncbi:MAG: hypothetical protein V4564_00315 [Pseudomonadota bacterium]|uniref:hypothetical protein n=1 Tax=Sphingomonas sp. ERG5 TaxID=1381597 RepID=UPI001269C110|nr:hypothetical protein [Sphingomonas sp. ERG5]